MPNTHPFSELREMGYKRWYQFGWRSPNILYRRLRHKYNPIFNARMFIQRGRRGWSDSDMWSLHAYLAEVIGGCTREMSRIAHGWPVMPEGDEITYEEWVTILSEIADGMDAALIYENQYDWPEGGEEKFNKAMDHLRKYWFGLWD